MERFRVDRPTGVPPTKLLVCPATQIGAAIAASITSSFVRVIVSSRSAAAFAPAALRRARKASRYFVTVTVTFSYVKAAPSVVTARSVYLPGLSNVTYVV